MKKVLSVVMLCSLMMFAVPSSATVILSNSPTTVDSFLDETPLFVFPRTFPRSISHQLPVLMMELLPPPLSKIPKALSMATYTVSMYYASLRMK